MEFSIVEFDELVEGNFMIFGVKVMYDWWKYYLKYSFCLSFGILRGCGGVWSFFYYIDRFLLMILEDVGDIIVKFMINNIIILCYLRSGI